MRWGGAREQRNIPRARQPIRCGDVPAQQQVSVPDGKDITKLTDDDLLKLQRQVADEVARRLTAG
jgi:hypothetical protein